jgi:hypothetical protein
MFGRLFFSPCIIYKVPNPDLGVCRGRIVEERVGCMWWLVFPYAGFGGAGLYSKRGRLNNVCRFPYRGRYVTREACWV